MECRKFPNVPCEFTKVAVCSCCKSDLCECVEGSSSWDLGGTCVTTGVLPRKGPWNFMQTTIPNTKSTKAATTAETIPRIPAMLNPVPVDLGAKVNGGNTLR